MLLPSAVSLDQPLHLFRLTGIVQGCLPGDLSFPAKCSNGLIHGDHTLPAAGSDGIVDLVVLIVPDHAADRARHVHDLAGGDHTALRIRQHLLRAHHPAGKAELTRK